jgi:hypothetical protein
MLSFGSLGRLCGLGLVGPKSCELTTGRVAMAMVMVAGLIATARTILGFCDTVCVCSLVFAASSESRFIRLLLICIHC